MSYGPSGPKKQCPQCGWDATGKVSPDAQTGDGDIPSGGKRPEAMEPVAYDFQCGNCGQEWTQVIS